MKHLTHALLAAAAFCCHDSSFGQSPLTNGDIAITGIHTNGTTDSVNLVTLVDIAAGTRIYLTDNGWTGTAFRGAAAGDYDGNEGLGYIDITALMPAGTVISSLTNPTEGTWNNISTSGVISASTAFLSLAQNGEQVYAFASSVALPTAGNPMNATGSMSHLSAIATTGTWTNASSSGTGSQPVSYMTGTVFNSSAQDNGATYFNLATPGNTARSKAQWLTALGVVGNWSTSASSTFVLPTSAFAMDAETFNWSTGSGTWQRGMSGQFGQIFSNLAGSTVNLAGTGGTVSITGGVSASTLNFNATGYDITASTLTLAGTPTISVGNAAHTATISSALAAGPGFAKTGSGTLVLSGTTGSQASVDIAGGTLQVMSTLNATSISVQSGAVVTGTGTLSGAAIFASGSRADAGVAHLGTLHFTAATFQDGSQADFYLTANTTSNRIDTSALTWGTAATIKVFLSYTPSAGDSFNLLDWTSLSGDTNLADNVDLTSASLGAGLAWDTSAFNTTGVLGVVSVVPEPSRAMLVAGGLASVLARRRRV